MEKEDLLNQLLDPNWLFGLSSIIISIYIFIVSLPAIIFQFSVHAEIRQVYFSRFNSIKRLKKSFLFFSLVVVVFILFISNPYIKYHLKTATIYTASQQKLLTYIYYLTALLLFAFFFLAANAQIRKWTLRKPLLEDVLSDIGTIVKQSYDYDTTIKQKEIDHLKLLSAAMNETSEKDLLLKTIRNIIEHCTCNINYNGFQLEVFIKEVILNGLLQRENFKNPINIKQTIELIEVIRKANDTINGSTPDLREIQKTYVKLAEITIRIEDDELLDLVSEKLLSTHNSFDNVRVVCKMQLNQGLFHSVSVKAQKYLTQFRELQKPNEKLPALRNSIVLFAWLNSQNNSQVTKLVSEKLSLSIKNEHLDMSHFEKIKSVHYSSGDFHTAECIHNLMVHLFGDSTPV